jgi:MSHA biogenesis protein MshI
MPRSRKSGLRGGVHAGADRIALAVVRRARGQRPRLEHCAVVPYGAGTTDIPGLEAAARSLELDRIAVTAALAYEDYQLVMVEAPDVQADELRSAVRWRLKDAIDFHIDDAVVDVFDLPAQERRGQARMMYAVAARSAAVARCSAMIAPIAPGLESIDIPELCLRNVSALLPQDQVGVALLVLESGRAELVLTRQGVLHLARRVELAAVGDDASSDPAEGAVDAAALALELQRSLDYYESSLGQTPITDLVIAPNSPRGAILAADLGRETSLRVHLLDLSGVLDCREPLAGDLQQSCLYAVGAALRDDAPAF